MRGEHPLTYRLKVYIEGLRIDFQKSRLTASKRRPTYRLRVYMIALGGLSGPPGHPPLLGGNPPKGGFFRPPLARGSPPHLGAGQTPRKGGKNELTSKLICTLGSVYKIFFQKNFDFPNQKRADLEVDLYAGVSLQISGIRFSIFSKPKPK